METSLTALLSFLIILSLLEPTMALALVLLSSLLAQANAWGPIFEPLKGGGWNVGHGSTVLWAAASGEDDEHNNNQRLPPSPPSTFFYQNFDLHQLFLDYPITTGENLVFQWEKLDDFVLVDENDEEECIGNECEEECSIPDEYKTLEGEAIDVMGFLGIKRAEPLRVREGYDSAWE